MPTNKDKELPLDVKAFKAGFIFCVIDRGVDCENHDDLLPNFYAKSFEQVIRYLNDWKGFEFYLRYLDTGEEFNLERRVK